MNPTLTLGIAGFSFEDLFSPQGLARLYQVWLDELENANPLLHQRYQNYGNPTLRSALTQPQISELLCEVAPFVSQFLIRLFGNNVRVQADEIRKKTELDLRLFRFKDQFVKRRMLKRALPKDTATILQQGQHFLCRFGNPAFSDERAFAEIGLSLLDQEQELVTQNSPNSELQQVRADLDLLADLLLLHKDELLNIHHWFSLQFPHLLDYQNLVPLRKKPYGPVTLLTTPDEKTYHRDGFDLTDPRMSFTQVLSEVDYCLYCHPREKDSCRTGLREKAGSFKNNPLGTPLHGCPLDEKISEAHVLKRQGDPIAALALICIDNPLCPGTGHRICNDCMKSCVYQKQSPVNVPQVETGILTDVLDMPYGVEIYGLLTRFNPLHIERPYPLPYRGKNVLVVGLGPAGYTLCHYLAQEGFGVVGIDGLTLEPPPQPYTGNPGKGQLPVPVKDYALLKQDLSKRTVLGFGGVSEYGITVRWDKNFLSLIYLTLARRTNIKFYGGIRFGGTITLDDAWQLGFDHIALAAGAGKPTLLSIENNLCRGIRQASDFLMSLQLQKTYQEDSLANLQIRLPALVIGGGLTAIDTATELLAYYVVQVEKTLARFEQFTTSEHGLPDPIREANFWNAFNQEEQEILTEQLLHGRAIRDERQAAQKENRPPRFAPLLDSFGGVTIVYRKHLVDSPAYHLNHEEVEKSMEEGVRYLECLSPMKAEVDPYGTLRAMRFAHQIFTDGIWRTSDEQIELPARTAFVAAGTKPNTMYEREYPATFVLDNKEYFTSHRAECISDGVIRLIPDPKGVFTSYLKDNHTVSFYGDNHPTYSGSVVKAMASAKHGFAQVAALFKEKDPQNLFQSSQYFLALCRRLDQELLATVVRVQRLAPTIVEIIVHAPLAARKFQPGQFYRLQNLASFPMAQNDVNLTMEGLALTGAKSDAMLGNISLIVLEMGASSNLCRLLQPGTPVVLMGPTGTPTEIPKNKTICLVGGGLGNAVLFSIAQALHQNGCNILYFAGYRRASDIFKQDEIEAYADQVVWASDTPISSSFARRPQDLTFLGNIVQAMQAYAKRELGTELFHFDQIDHFIVIGSDRMMAAVKQAKQTSLRTYLKAGHQSIASVNSPMQCMMKEICAQCLQRQVDPISGKERFVFSCVNQDQPLEQIDFDNLSARLRQNSMQEKLTLMWLERLLGSQ